MNYKKIISMVCLFAISFEIFPVQALNYVYAETRLEAQIGDSNEKTEEKVDSENKEKVEDSTIKQDVESEDNTVKQEVESEDNTIKQEVESGDSNTPNEGNESAEPTKILGSSLVRTYLGEAFDAKAGIKAIDSNGKDITDSVSIEGKVDTNKVGSYELKYSVKDESGKTATLTRKVNVINKNIFNTFIEKVNGQTKEKTKELGFSIYLDNNTSKFLVENQSKEKLDPTKKDEVVFKIRVIDRDNKEKLKVELLGDDTGDSEKLNPLKELEYAFGDYIEIHSTNAKNGFNIEGEMSGDIDTKKAKDEKKSGNVKKEDYSDGVDNMDYLSNVRFKITEEGIETVYNNAPEISGLEPMEKLLTNRKKQLEGIKVTDDHDGVIANNKIVITEEKDDKNNVIALKYKVSDSWGRSTEATRVVTLKELTSNFSSAPTNTLNNNRISVKGIKFGTDSQYGDALTRFKVQFDDRSRKIKVIEQDGRSMNSRIEGTYFAMALYDAKGNLKRDVEIKGTDRSNTSKLDDLRYYGWPYQYGDQLRLWHHEAPVKISIAGTVAQDEDKDEIDFENGLTKEILNETRFELTSSGLKHILNTPPTIIFPEEKEAGEGEKLKTVTRGEEFDLREGVVVDDDREGSSFEVNEKDFDSTKLGDQKVRYTATDNWGVETVKERKIRVVEKNEIEKVSIKVKSKDDTPMFSIGFDEIKRQFVLKTEETVNPDKQLDPNNKSTYLRIRVFNKFNVKKREFDILGKDTIESSSIQKLMNYKYEEGDYLHITPTEPSKVTIEGKIEGKPTDLDYSSGVDNLDKWVNVRFQLIDGKFKYHYNDKPVITGHSDITIERGNEPDVLNGMTVTDDKDNNGAPIELTSSNTIVTIKSGEGIFLGEQVYEIKYTDSWGRSASVPRKVIINPKSPVEKRKIELLGKNDEIVLSFSYDSIDKKFRVLSSNPQYSFADLEKENAFVLRFYNSERRMQKEIVLKSVDLINKEFLAKLSDFTIEDDWYMTLWYHDYSKIRITPINPTSENDTPQDSKQESATPNTNITFENDDEMENTRFEISNSDITSIYNKAPEIKGADDVSIVYGTEFNPMKDVRVEDEDSELEKAVIISGEVETDVLGDQELHYEVTDTYGRRTYKKRTVTVVPVYTTNEVVYKDGNGDKLFSIGINKSATGFTVSLPETKSTESIQEDFIFKVFDNTHKKLYELKIDQGTTITADLFNDIKTWIVRPGYFFSVNSNDLTKIQVTGRLEKSKEVSLVDYSKLTETENNRDAVENVRFELTENIVKAVYNKAPTILIANTPAPGDGGTESPDDVVDGQSTDEATDGTGNTDIVRAQAVELDDYNLLEGVSVKDDKDDISRENVKITYPEEILTDKIEEAKNLIGTTVTITYQVADSWGRLSNPITRELTIKSAMDDMSLKFLYAPTGGRGEANLVPNYEERTLDIGFNMEESTLELTEGTKSRFKGNNVQYGAFAILDKDGQSKFATRLGKDNTFDIGNPIFDVREAYSSVTGDEFIRNFNSKKGLLNNAGRKIIEYGDKIVIKTYQSPFLHIEGKVRDNQEDYSQGANLGAILANSKFEVTPSGLKQIYDGPTIQSNDFSQLTIYSIVAGMQAVNMYLDTTDTNDLRLKAVGLDKEWIDTLNKNRHVFNIQIKNSNGETVKGGDHLGATRPNDLAASYNNTPVQKGGYLTIKWYDSSQVKNSKLYNLPKVTAEDGSQKPEQYGFQKEIDYSGDITNATYFDDVRFYFTERGFVPVYNAAPTFEGVEDKSISIEDSFDPREGVTVKDYFDTDKDSTDYTVNPDTIDTSNIGEHILTYSATDSWEREGTHERKITVKSKIHENKFDFYDKDGIKSFSIDFEPNITGNTDNGVLKVTKHSDDLLDVDRADEEIVKIEIYGSNKQLKEKVTLLGRDSSSSEKLNVLNEREYKNGDYIKVWRAPSSNKSSVKGVEVIGEVDGDNFDFTNPEHAIDHMSNTVFYIRPSGLHAIYNDAPELNVEDERVIYYGNPSELLNGVTATDQEDNGNLTIKATPEEIDTNKLGTTRVTYSVTDSYGRTTSKEVNVTVRSKSYLNAFEICGESTSKSNGEKFYIGFNPNINAFVFYNNNNEVVALEDLDLSIIPSDLNIVVYNRFGGKKIDIQFSENDNNIQKKEKLGRLQSTEVESFDMIQVITSKSSRVRVKGSIVGKTNNYDDGFNSADEMRNVRFQVKNEGLTEVKKTTSNSAYFEGLEELTVKRGEEADLLKGVTLKHPNEVVEEITTDGFDKMKEGTQIVTYSAQDSWGTTFKGTRTVKVLPYNKLEEVRITVSDRDKAELIKVKFDAIESKLSYELGDTSSLISKLRKAVSFAKSLPEDTIVLKVATFNTEMDELENISITKSDILNESQKLEEIKNIEFLAGGFIGIDIYDFNNLDALAISGPVTYPDKSNNQYRDMRHVRYRISEDGLKAVYNEAPEVTVSSEEIKHKVGESYDLKTALTIKDDKDSIEVEFKNYDPYEVGKYEVTAIVTDKWGLATEVTFPVYVLSYLDDNTMTLVSNTGEEIVKLKFDSKNGRLVTTFNEGNLENPILSSSEAEIIKLNIYDENHGSPQTITINGGDTGNTIKTKLERFNNYQYHYNYFIGFEVKDSAKKLIKITNVKTENKGPLASVNYENGVNDIDHFNNVRFELDPYGLAAIYNEAPVIHYDLGNKEAVKSLDVKDYNLLDGVSVSDDKDKLDVKDIEIKYNDSKESSALNLGPNTIKLTIKDKWGRESAEESFNLELTSAMDTMDIKLLYAENGLKPNLDKVAAKLTFDMKRGKILVEDLSPDHRFKQNQIQYGAFGVYNESDAIVYRAILGEFNSFDNTGEFANLKKHPTVATLKSDLEGLNIGYGYKIKIKIYQSPFVYINGKVMNAQENYEEGAYLSDILNESKFKITEEGLVQEYTKPVVPDKQNDIMWLSGVAGDRLFKININPDTKRLTVTKYTEEPLDTLYTNNTDLFSIDVYNSQGVRTDGITATTRQNSRHVFDALNDRPFEFGGYMTIKILPTDRNRMRNMKIFGNIEKRGNNLEDVDFSGEIKDVAYFNESKFYFTENGLSLSYNDAPAFSGLNDIILLKDDNLKPVDLEEGVNVYDDVDGERIQYRIVDANDRPINNINSYIPEALGAHEVFYTATDSMNRTTKVPRFIWLQSASQITVNNENLLTVQEARQDLQTDAQRLQYLIDLVTVTDEEDDANGNSIKIKPENIKGTFDPNVPDDYDITYIVTDSDGNVSTETFTIHVVRTINVSVPTYIPFQLVTNLIKKENQQELDPFISGVMKVTNNYITPVDVYLKEFTKTSGEGGLEIVEPTRFTNWDDLTEEETMKYIALGIYNKSNFDNSKYNTKESPLWLVNNSTDNSDDKYIGRLPKATDLNTPKSGELSFTSKHGEKFIGGTSRAKFNLVLEFR